MSIEPESSVDFDADMQTIRDYVSAVAEAKSKLALAHLSAIDNLQATIQGSSPAEAKPDILGAVFKAGLKAAEKAGVSAVKEATGADLAPLVDILHGIDDAITRAAKAQLDLTAGEWIKSVRSAVTNAYSRDPSGQSLRNLIEREYNANSEGSRGGYIAAIQIELDALQTMQAPRVESLEVAMYESWINENFNGDCIDGTGIAYVQFDDDDSLSSAEIIAPLGDRIARALNKVMSAAGLYSIMQLDVVKKVCRGDESVCFEGNNVVRKASDNDETQTFLSSPDTWQQIREFSVGS